MSRAAYFFCADLGRDPVAARVFAAAERVWSPRGTGVVFDGHEVLEFDTPQGHTCLLARLGDVLSHDYRRYLPALSTQFSDVDLAGLVNWHQGANAPDRALTVHATGDMASGEFGPASPGQVRGLLLGLEEERVAAGLTEFTTEVEATHWSGIPYAGDPKDVPRYRVPLIDVEIGSSEASWSNPVAAEVVARALPAAFRPLGAARSVLCIGGVHIERGFGAAVLAAPTSHPLAISHVLPNHWLVSGGYDQPEGLERLRSCAASVVGGVHLVAYHDNLKGAFKDQARRLAEVLGVPAVNHKKLRVPAELPVW
jgi:hypothetical protein